jgi:hypothetical protein
VPDHARAAAQTTIAEALPDVMEEPLLKGLLVTISVSQVVYQSQHVARSPAFSFEARQSIRFHAAVCRNTIGRPLLALTAY